MAQYGAWLRASPTKIPWKTQGPKSHSGSSSYEKQNVTEEENFQTELEHVENVPLNRLEQLIQRKDDVVVVTSTSQHVIHEGNGGSFTEPTKEGSSTLDMAQH